MGLFDMTKVKVKRLNPDATLPQYGYPGDAGMDLSVVGEHVLNPGESRDLPTGIAVETPPGIWGRITGRSSTLRKRGLFVNEGVIDEGYRGELLIYVTNRQSTPVEITSGDRLAQLILHPVHQHPAEWADELSQSARGDAGFGSTGYRSAPVAGANGVRDIDITTATSDALQDTTRPMTEPTGKVYLGGAVDVGDARLNDLWRHEGWYVDTYCPIHECADLDDAGEIIKRNTKALDYAADAVFLLDAFSVGTPIEAWHRIIYRARGGVLVFPHNERSVFVEYLSHRPDVIVVPTLDEARRVVRTRASLRWRDTGRLPT